MCVLSCFGRVWLFVTLWTDAFQAPLSIGFSRQECWSGLPCPSPGDLPDPGIKPISHVSPASAAGSLPPVPLGKPICIYMYISSLLDLPPVSPPHPSWPPRSTEMSSLHYPAGSHEPLLKLWWWTAVWTLRRMCSKHKIHYKLKKKKNIWREHILALREECKLNTAL